jgi:hypothetical protein
VKKSFIFCRCGFADGGWNADAYMPFHELLCVPFSESMWEELPAAKMAGQMKIAAKCRPMNNCKTCRSNSRIRNRNQKTGLGCIKIAAFFIAIRKLSHPSIHLFFSTIPDPLRQ